MGEAGEQGAGGAAGPSDPRSLRRALANFVTGVTVVTTTEDGGRPRGFTANSFTSVSLSPPLVLVCIADTAASRAAFDRCAAFAINVLGEAQRPVSDIFASKAADKFARVSWHPGRMGAPLIAGCLARFECGVHDRRQAGDHLVLIGEVASFDAAAGRPLLYGQGGYVPLGPACGLQPPGA
jgi:flavin reductase (DIM6/NTAB) family NADH-FMN oxidoreductase RutF